MERAQGYSYLPALILPISLLLVAINIHEHRLPGFLSSKAWQPGNLSSIGGITGRNCWISLLF
jgi:hypothetical protein